MTTKAKDAQPFPLHNILRDLALLRVFEANLESTVPANTDSDDKVPVDDMNVKREEDLVDQSYQFVQEARQALKIHHRAGVGGQGDRIEEVRNKLEDLLEGVSV